MYKSFTNISWGTYYFFSQNSGSSKTEEFLTLILFCVLHNVVKSQHFLNLLSKRKLAKKPSRYCLQRSTFQLGYLTTMTGSKEQNFCSQVILNFFKKRQTCRNNFIFNFLLLSRRKGHFVFRSELPIKSCQTCQDMQYFSGGINRHHQIWMKSGGELTRRELFLASVQFCCDYEDGRGQVDLPSHM